MPPSLLVAGELPAGNAPSGGLLRWPDDGPDLVERNWARLAPALDSVARATGVRRLGVDEALALPQLTALAAIAELAAAAPGELNVVGDPASIVGLVALAASLAYAEERVVGLPLDVLGRLQPRVARLPGLSEAGGVLSAARAWIEALPDPARWRAEVARDGSGDRAARVLNLIGMRTADDEPHRSAERCVPEVVETPDGYELRIAVRGITKDGLRLARAVDRLLVTVDGTTVPVAVPAALQRCRVSGATTEDDVLVIRFEIDESRWRR